MHISSELLGKFRELIHNRSALAFTPGRLATLEMRLRQRLDETGVAGFREYYTMLDEDPREQQRLIELLTTKETRFFRLPAQFEALREWVVPELEAQLPLTSLDRMTGKGGMKTWRVPMRIWSAGCATGEETYSIAMTLFDALRSPAAWDIEILATDISASAIDLARQGVYASERATVIPARLREKYVTEGAGIVEMKEDILKRISFAQFNLKRLIDAGAGDVPVFADVNGKNLNLMQRFDIVFCRNVMIYFDFASQQRLVDGLFECLKPGGCLFMGDAEFLHIYRHKFKPVEKCGAFYYRKPALEKQRKAMAG